MRVIAGLIIAALLAGCGVDGAPVRPEANVGVKITPSGVRTSTSVGVSAGNVSIGVGL